MGPLLVSGSAHPALGADLASALDLTPTGMLVERFPDGELTVTVQGDVLGRDVFVVQPALAPVGDHLLELLLGADALRRSGAASISAVIPYLAYARQERRTQPGQALGARVIADLLATGGLRRLVAVDLHVAALEGFFSMPVEHLSAIEPLTRAAAAHVGPETVVVAPDLGAAKRAHEVARRLGVPSVVVYKARHSGREVSAIDVMGDVAGRVPLVVDDMISTGGTICAALEVLRSRGARAGAVVVATHGLFVDSSAARLAAAGVRQVVVTDSVPPSPTFPVSRQVVSLAPLLADCIRRLAA